MGIPPLDESATHFPEVRQKQRFIYLPSDLVLHFCRESLEQFVKAMPRLCFAKVDDLQPLQSKLDGESAVDDLWI